MAASWLATAWDQNTGLMSAAPATTLIEQIALDWVLEVLDLPRGAAGAFDPAGPVIEWARERGAWVHVDGAFGLWARVGPARRALAAGRAFRRR